MEATFSLWLAPCVWLLSCLVFRPNSPLPSPRQNNFTWS